MAGNPFDTGTAIETRGGRVRIFSLKNPGTDRLPYSLRVLLESLIRRYDGRIITEETVRTLAEGGPCEIPWYPGRVLLQDFTGVPCLVDLAGMRSAMARLQGDPSKVNPQVRCDLVIDHSIQVDRSGTPDAMRFNVRKEFERNGERYRLIKWGCSAFNNFHVVPPNTGICHQINLELLARVVLVENGIAFPDSLVGTDSHTTMINGLAVLGWGVGGIEAEAVMLGQPMLLRRPAVVGVRLRGRLAEGTTATDLVLTVTQKLRRHGVVDKFVEFTGDGLDHLPVADRATISNMAPEYGATCGFFPVDDEVLDYLRRTGRSEEQVDLVERYCKEQGLWRSGPEPEFDEIVEIDLSSVEPSLAGPKRPQDRVPLSGMKQSFRASLRAPVSERGFEIPESALGQSVQVVCNGAAEEIRHGSIVIAAITSCTNTSNPSLMVGAGLLARKAVERGLKVKPFVKTSLAPGSRVVTEYLEASGLSRALDALGFQTVGYGCTTCIGNSGPLPESVASAVEKENLVVAAVLSGNRNFEGRVNPHTRANYLASPPLVVAYALAGTVDIDFRREPIGTDRNGTPVYLRELWPTRKEIEETISRVISPGVFRKRYRDIQTGPAEWRDLEVKGNTIYCWDPESTYVQEPPYFEGLPLEPEPPEPVRGARVLALLGDSVTTDHISPAGTIAADSPAGRYLIARGVEPKDFNSYGSRRGNHQVMMRGTFANIRVRNRLVPETEGGWTVHLPSGERMSIYDAAMRYRAEGIPLVVIAGRAYGMGSSRDWAAKGVKLLGVRAVLAESFERIHRSNLVGMGVLPLEFLNRPQITGRETFEIPMPSEPGQILTVKADGGEMRVRCRVDTPLELEYFRHGGILPYVLRRLLKDA